MGQHGTGRALNCPTLPHIGGGFLVLYQSRGGGRLVKMMTFDYIEVFISSSGGKGWREQLVKRPHVISSGWTALNGLLAGWQAGRGKGGRSKRPTKADIARNCAERTKAARERRDT
jgi:hypothetical protein